MKYRREDAHVRPPDGATCERVGRRRHAFELAGHPHLLAGSASWHVAMTSDPRARRQRAVGCPRLASVELGRQRQPLGLEPDELFASLDHRPSECLVRHVVEHVFDHNGTTRAFQPFRELGARVTRGLVRSPGQRPLGTPPLPATEWPRRSELAHRKGWRVSGVEPASPPPPSVN